MGFEVSNKKINVENASVIIADTHEGSLIEYALVAASKANEEGFVGLSEALIQLAVDEVQRDG